MAPRTRSQGLRPTFAQESDVDLLLAAASKSDEVVMRLVRQLGHCITFNPRGSLEAWKRQLLRVLAPGATDLPAPPRSPVHAPLVHMVVSEPDTCAYGLLTDPEVVQETPEEIEGGPRTPTQQLPMQCAGCLALQAEVAALRQASQLASNRLQILEQQLRSRAEAVPGRSRTPQQCNEISQLVSQTLSDLPQTQDGAEDTSPAALSPPLQSAGLAKNLKVVVHNLPCKGVATPALLLSTFTQFCRAQLHMSGLLTVRVVKVFKSSAGFAAGLLALRSEQEVDALFVAKRQHLDASCAVSIEHNRTRQERCQRGEARRHRRPAPARQPQIWCARTSPTLDTRTAAGEQASITTQLRADAPVFVPATTSQSLSDHDEHVAQTLHRE
jgi:hypothetical protein